MNSTVSTSNNEPKRWIRGVNLGGWLVIERYIVPYMYSLTNCHVQGNLCWYPGQLSAPSKNDPDYKLCNLQKCKPVLETNIFNNTDYPVDEWHLAEAFDDPAIAERWLNFHFDNFITRDDLVQIKAAGLTHIRVPLPHWMLGNIRSNEPWIAGDRYHYFVRLCEWARELGLHVWPNLHTAPGSQNGFDNSGIENIVYTCGGWGDANGNIERTLDILKEITEAMVRDGLTDVVTGFGILNEPFGDCDRDTYKLFLENGLQIVRDTMGNETNVFVSDMFGAPKFNDGQWWLDASLYRNTFLDTHFYHTFDAETRVMSPKNHIDHVCHADDPQGDITSCCYEDAPTNQIPSRGVQRISAEWSAAFDAMPGELLQYVMQGIAETGVAPDFDRQLSAPRQEFLSDFVQAQMVAYEATDSGMAHGWFYWTWKMEGGAFAEWDFSRGLREGWIPSLPPPTVSSQDVFGTCDDILARTNDTMDIVHAYPWGDESYWKDNAVPVRTQTTRHHVSSWLLALVCCILVLVALRVLRRRQRVFKYTPIGEVDGSIEAKSMHV